MESVHSFWQLSDELRGQSTDDQKWMLAASKLAEQTRSKHERRFNVDVSKNSDFARDNVGFQEDSKYGIPGFDMGTKFNNNISKIPLTNAVHGMNTYQNPSFGNLGSINGGKYMMNQMKEPGNVNNKEDNSSMEKRFKTLPAAEMLPRDETLGGYIFVCNNDTMQEDLKRQLFGLPPRYRDSVRAITPGLPLFLYNYTTHQLHGIFEAATFGGSNIDPTAWEDKKCKGESRFPAQVRIRVRKMCKPLEEDGFRPVLHHYDGPKFRLELSIPETLELLDLCEQADV